MRGVEGDGRRTTELSMLWESVDPAAALTARFGFTDTAHATSWLSDTLDDVWGLQVQQCERLVLSASNLLAWITADRAQVVAKCSVDTTRFARLQDVATLTAWLDTRGIPVATPIPSNDGRLQVERRAVSIGLQPRADGHLLAAGDPAQVEAAGRMLASLHDVLAAYPHPFGGERARGDRQLVHNDFRSANLLYDGTRISAVLDLEEATYRDKIADLARTTVLLATRYHDWAPTDPATRDAFVAAYSSVAPLTRAQRSDLDRGVRAVLHHFGWT